MKVKVGTRGSKLALVQTEYVIEHLKGKYPENEYVAEVIKTSGDMDLSRPLDALGSKGIFVDRIEEALLSGEIQMAVHSMKDMPGTVREGLVFADPMKREDARDALILRDAKSLLELPKGARIATGSKRRSFQLLKLRPDIEICPIRGNIDTRLKKLETGQGDDKLDGIILAAAGLKRLGLEGWICEYFDVKDMIPAPSQGTLAIEVHRDNHKLLKMVNSLSDPETKAVTFLERGFLNAMGGDCHLPVGAYAFRENGRYELFALFGNEDGTKLARAHVVGDEASQDMIDRAVYDIRKHL